jgi:hypothetical protein
MPNRKTYEEVKTIFENKNYKLLSLDYINATTNLQCQCPNGHIKEISLQHFKEGRGCIDCFRDNLRKLAKEQKLPQQSENYKKQMPNIMLKVKRTNLIRYGVEYVSQLDDIKERKKETLKNKYGFEYTMQIPAAKEKYQQTLLSRYGVPSMAYLSRCCSKESQKLFWEIHNKLSPEVNHKDHFADLNAEFVIGPTPEYFKYDYVNSILCKCIEYNGYNFHPRSDQSDDEINWKAFHPDTTVREARAYESKKLGAIQARGYSVLVVWDYEFHKDFNKLVVKCMDFLKPENP